MDFNTVSVLVRLPSGTTTNRYHDKQVQYKEITADVLIEPLDTTEINQLEPLSERTGLTLHFKKSFTHSLAGALVVIEGETYKVIGNPQSYMQANTPGAFNRKAEVRFIGGKRI